jgi:hypothetical protein
MASTLNEESREQGVQFAAVDGHRSSQRAGRTILADAVRAVAPDLATRIERTKDWRKSYIVPFTDSVVAGAGSGKDALRIAADGLDALHSNLTFVRNGGETTLRAALEAPSDRFETRVVEGTGERQKELVVPYRGDLLRGDSLRRQLETWAKADAMEPSCRTALSLVVDNPEWLDLSDRYFALLGASSEMGPLGPLSAWGANILAIDLPRAALWNHILEVTHAGSGTLHAPVTAGSSDDLAQSAGFDLLTMTPEARAWLGGFAEPFTIGNYVYADGANFVRLASAVDAVIDVVLRSRPDVSLAYLATPTDVFAVPEEVATIAIGKRKSSVFKRAIAATSGGRLYAPNFESLVPGENGRRWGISDSLVPIQGSNYALAKSLQRWRATLTREDGTVTSANVAPASNTVSVTKNKMLSAVYRGAPSFGVEIFEPATTRVLMAALLVHDLRNEKAAAHPGTDLDHPFDLFADAALHGGIWRLPYQPRSILPLGLVKGFLKRS